MPSGSNTNLITNIPTSSDYEMNMLDGTSTGGNHEIRTTNDDGFPDSG